MWTPRRLLKRIVGRGVRKTEGVPEHESCEGRRAIHERQGDKKSPKICTRLKSCEPLYSCPCAPFYRVTKGLLHSENTLKSSLKTTWDLSGFLHECFPFTKPKFSPRGWFTNLSHEFRQTLCFEGVRFLRNFPTLAPRGSGLTPTIWFHENS
jgi:hypothetical protein